jgi:hypothetical protein
LLIAFPHADDQPSGNHESLESKIPKRKKARPNTHLSCKIEYFIETTSAYLSGRSAFFTDDDQLSTKSESSKPTHIIPEANEELLLSANWVKQR